MLKKMLPWNIILLSIQPKQLEALPQITHSEAVDRNFNMHPEGLFSTSIFGKVGDERRLTSFAHINMKVSLIHPLIWYHLMSMRAMWGEIAAGKLYATFDEKAGEFIKADILTGRTGYQFFAENWRKLKIERTKSLTRNNSITVIERYRGNGDMSSLLLVIPAGLRDIETDENNVIVKDELNDLYRRMLAQSNSISDIVIKTNPKAIDSTRYSMQLTWNSIFEYFIRNIGGKNHMMQGQYLSRNIVNGTRNVITALSTEPTYYNDPGVPGYDNMTVGIYQAIRACEPNAIFAMRKNFTDKIFVGNNAPIALINRKTLRTEMIQVDPNYQERWRSVEGLTKIFLLYEREALRTMPIVVKDHYLCLTWRGKIDGVDAFKLVNHTDAIPQWVFESEYTLTPTTMIEFFYATTYSELDRTPAWSTRYPIGDAGSTYPNELFIRTTEKSERRYCLTDNWEIDKERGIAYCFPSADITAPIINASSPHSSKLEQTNADFDGDKMATNAMQLPESKAAMRGLMNRWESLITATGELIGSCQTDTVRYVLYNMTGDIS